MFCIVSGDLCRNTLVRAAAWLLRAGCVVLAIAAITPARASTAIVLNSDDDSISILDAGSYRETARPHIGRAPHHLILTPDGKTLIIAMASGNELVFIDRETGTVKDRLPVSDPYQLGFSPDAKWFVTTSLRLDRIDIYDASNYRLLYRLPAPSMPSHMAFSADSSTVFISLQASNQLVAIDLATGKPRWTVPVGRQPAGVWMARNGHVLVGIMGSDHVAEVDPRDGSVLRRIQTGRGAHNFQMSPDGKALYVTNRVAGTISVLDPNTLQVTGMIAAPGGPDDMVFSPDGKEMWVTGRFRSSVDVIEAETGTLKARIPVGRSPHGIFVY